ncbi:hypothetical protein WJX84_000747 [Apatococcus fuscideae]|uniref:protein-histidine N-methyltransferase n=1 Tax=Apatococcus fuscideae TaxID=2026836 RepID=A0AAW1SV96_9CHLO
MSMLHEAISGDPDGFRFNFMGEPGVTTASADQASSEAVAIEVNARSQISRESIDLDEVCVHPELTLLKRRLTSEDAAELLGESEVSDNDLLPGKYEGGFKLWECAVDLASFLSQEWQIGMRTGPGPMKGPSIAPTMAGKKVLELGCGHGLPGIVALINGAEVHFQDFNSQVLMGVTGPNIEANLGALSGEVQQACGSPRFFAGDWEGVGRLVTKQRSGATYDLVLSAETLYNLESQEILLNCLTQALCPPHGEAYLASKKFYFGVGGGTAAFRKLVRRQGIFECKTVANVDDGISNKREILRLSFPQSIAGYF